jgi:hypothetical protein
MVEEVEDEPLDCKTILIVGGVMLAGFFILSFYNTSRLHDLVQQLLNRPEPTFYTHDGESETPCRTIKTHNGRGSC